MAVDFRRMEEEQKMIRLAEAPIQTNRSAAARKNYPMEVAA